TVTVAPDVTGRVRVVGLGGPANAGTQFTSFGTVTNVSQTAIPGPLHLVVGGLPAGVDLVNAARRLASRHPVNDLRNPRLEPGQTVNVLLGFSNPTGQGFTPQITVIDGPGGDDSAAVSSSAFATTPGFVVNMGQADPEVSFLAQGSGYSLFLTSSDALLA